MSYLYSVYSFRPQHYAMESLLESPVKEIFSTIFFLIGFVGAVANVLLLYTFYKYFTYWRFTTRLWVNISLTLLLSSIALMFRAVGDHYERFSNTQLSCRLRYFFPISLDISCLGCLLVMFMERLTVVHFPNLYIYNEKNNNTKLMYSWFYGLWFLVFKLFIIDQNNIPDRCVTPVSLAFPLETVTLITMIITVTLLLITFQGYVFTPNVNTNIQMTWVTQEVGETIRVLLLGAGIAALWAPKHILCLLYLTYGCPEFEYQIWMMLLHIPARLTLLVPLAVLTRKDDFYECAMIVLRRLPQREGLDNNIAAEEMQADFILRSVLKAMYPNHPELIKLSIASRPATSVPRGAMLSSASGGGSSNKQLGNVTSVSFDQPVSETYSDSKANVPLLSNTSIISSV